jgi:tetratricopeptide (TPR) repeat protein
MMQSRLAVVAVCATLLSACTTSQNTPIREVQACAKIKNLSLGKDGTQYANPVLAIEVLSECDATSQNSPAGTRAALLQMRSIAYAQTKDYVKATTDFEDALRLRPARTAWDDIGLAALYRKSGQPERALALLRKMLDDHLGMNGKGTTPGMPSYYHLGLTLVALEKWPEATEAFTEGLTYQPDYSWAYFYRALAYNGMNDADHARADLRKGQKLVETSSNAIRTQTQEALKQEPFATLFERYPE